MKEAADTPPNLSMNEMLTSDVIAKSAETRLLAPSLKTGRSSQNKTRSLEVSDTTGLPRKKTDTPNLDLATEVDREPLTIAQSTGLASPSSTKVTRGKPKVIRGKRRGERVRRGRVSAKAPDDDDYIPTAR